MLMQRLTRSDGFVIAEAGVNHNGDLAAAHRLVDIAAECGADAVKFQTFDPDELVIADAAKAPYQHEEGSSGGTQREMLERLALPDAAWRELSSHAAERDLVFLSTPFDRRSADLLQAIGVEAFKVPSGELTNLVFIEDLASRGLPLLISTGMSDLEEVEAAMYAAEPAPQRVLLHCVSLYPTAPEVANIRAIATLRDRFDVPIGWSDHTTSNVTAIMAVALGATVFERHLTEDKRQAGPDHSASADPAEFASYISDTRTAFSAIGSGIKAPSPQELEMRRYTRRSYHARHGLLAGSLLSDSDVVLARPADGAAPTAKVVGRRLRRDLRSGAPILEGDLD
jgi:N-acetylneuraminate synthase/N,N'-diacetyllegionaminate synthase